LKRNIFIGIVPGICGTVFSFNFIIIE